MTPRPKPAPSRRSFWIRQITLWHWVSSGVCLGGMLLFTVTGITLNHASAISSTPAVLQRQAKLPAALRTQLAALKQEGKYPVPENLAKWVESEFATRIPDGPAEWSEAEIYISLPRPGGDAWAAVDREAGTVRYEKSDRGWIAYLNDLHKGRHTGNAWQVFIDVLAAACLVFTFTGLVLLWTHASKRPSTWPIVAFSVVLPVIILMLFVHN